MTTPAKKKSLQPSMLRIGHRYRPSRLNGPYDALIIAVVALGVILAIVFLRDQIKSLFNKAGSELSTQPS